MNNVLTIGRESISYRAIVHPVYKYQLTSPQRHQLAHAESGCGIIKLEVNGRTWCSLDLSKAKIHIRRWYCWDGASGPAFDSATMMRASLIHDALYQMIAAGVLPKNPWKRHADREFRRIAREDGSSWVRSSYAYLAVRVFGGGRDAYEPPVFEPQQ